MIVPKRVLVDVALKVRRADRVVSAADATFQQAPEPFDGVGVRVAMHVDPSRMVDSMVLVAACRACGRPSARQ